ncbi:MAG: SGNH/GDSL hydrolase family protein [Clostridia bacterium]|nr:SGNH/GDSL hydrolase family protein [Clostridia bacterium]
MVLSNSELQKIYCGAYSFETTEDGYLQAFQFNNEQMEYFKKTFDFWYERCAASTSKTLEFRTEAETISFEYKIIWVGSEDTFELAVDSLITDIKYIRDMDKEGKITFKLPAGSKNVTIYLPADSTALIRNFETDKPVIPTDRGTKVLWLGDSITQGYGTLRSACTYVSVANRILNYDIINQGIGGYIYDKNILMKMDGYYPEKIIVALGTNQFGCETMKDIEEYYERLMEIYGNDIPVLCVTPLWRGDVPDGFETLSLFCDRVKEIAGRYSNVKIVEGFKLVPHLPEYYLDKLHPNCLGAEIYGRNLVKEIERLGF